MRTCICIASLVIIAVSASPLEETLAKFQAFKSEHGKSYETQAEEAKRFAIFGEKLRAIEEHNALYEQGLVSYAKGINQFSDWTQDEFKAYLRVHSKPNLNATQRYVKSGVAVPEAVDWRSEGQVTGVKNQGQCGSCWSFSVTGSTEGAYARATGQLVSLSEQQLVDCTTSINGGCNGGQLDATFPYIQQYGLQSEASYPYSAEDGSCQYDASQVVTTVSDYYSLPSQDESALLEAVGSVGPVSIAIDANYLSDYSYGVYADSRCTEELDHGVLVVGYGNDGGYDYWIVKNSWGGNWGESGYFKLLRGSNECGVADDAVYPIV